MPSPIIKKHIPGLSLRILARLNKILQSLSRSHIARITDNILFVEVMFPTKIVVF